MYVINFGIQLNIINKNFSFKLISTVQISFSTDWNLTEHVKITSPKRFIQIDTMKITHKRFLLKNRLIVETILLYYTICFRYSSAPPVKLAPSHIERSERLEHFDFFCRPRWTMIVTGGKKTIFIREGGFIIVTPTSHRPTHLRIHLLYIRFRWVIVLIGTQSGIPLFFSPALLSGNAFKGLFLYMKESIVDDWLRTLPKTARRGRAARSAL